MDKQKKNKIIFISITIFAFLSLIGGGILTIISVMIKDLKLLYIALPLIGFAFILYIVLFIILVFFFKKKEWFNWIGYGDLS